MNGFFKRLAAISLIAYLSGVSVCGVNVRNDLHDEKAVAANMPHVVEVDAEPFTPINVDADLNEVDEIDEHDGKRRLGGGRYCGDSCDDDWDCGGSCSECRHGCCERPRHGSRDYGSCGDYCQHDGDCGNRCPNCRHGICKKSRYDNDWGDGYDNDWGDGYDYYDNRYDNGGYGDHDRYEGDYWG